MERRVDFHCNAFINFCLQANPEEISWLNRIFGNTRIKSLSKFRYDRSSQCIVFRFKNGDHYSVYRFEECRGTFSRERGEITRIIQSYPWTLRSDHSASILSRDALLCIYDRIKDPRDMWSFMQVNKAFHYAGSTYSGYTLKIERLKLGSCVEILPFDFIKDERRLFFALCFISCRPDLEKDMVKAIGKNFSSHPLFHYCFNLSRFSVHMKEDVVLNYGRLCIFTDTRPDIFLGKLMGVPILLGDKYCSAFSAMYESITDIL